MTRTPGGRRAGAFIALVVLVAILAPVALAASWVRGTVFDTDRYVGTVAPLASDPTIQAAVSEAASRAALDRLAATGAAQKAQDALTAVGVPETVAEGLLLPVRGQVQQVVTSTVARVVASEQFVESWTVSNRTAHTALVALLRGEDISDLVVVEGATVGIALGSVVAAIESQLVEAGVPLAERIPPVAITVPVMTIEALPLAQRAARVLDLVGRWLSLAVVALFTAAVLAAPDHARGLQVAALAALASLVAVSVGLLLARWWIVAGAGGAGSPSGDVLAVTLNQLLSPLRSMIRWSVVLLVALASLGWFLGDGPAATRLRSRLAQLRREGSDGIRSRLSPLVRARLGIAAAALLVAVLWDEPSGAVLLLLLVAALVGMVWAELLLGGGRSAPSRSAEP